MKIALLFPGYGSQVVGMGKELYDESRIMQEYFEEASNCLDKNFVKLCFASSDAELGRAENGYPALFLVTTAIAAFLKEEGITAHIVSGYNLGEYAAIHTAGGLSLPDGLYLLAKYAALYQSIIDDTPCAALEILGASWQDVEALCLKGQYGDNQVYVAAYNTPTHVIIAGHADAVERVRELAAVHHAMQVQTVPVEFGLHSVLMDPVVANYKMYMEKVDVKDLSVPLINNSDAAELQRADEVKTGMVKQIYTPIAWYACMQKLADYACVVEVGPGNRLCKLVKDVYPEKHCLSVNKKSDVEELKKIIETLQPEQQKDEHGSI